MVNNMDNDQLLILLKSLIEKYLDNDEVKSDLLSAIEPGKIKYILAKFEKYKKADVTSEERAIIKDIYFKFC